MAAAATLASGGQGSPPCTGYHFSLGLTPARARAKGFILWTPSLFPDAGLRPRPARTLQPWTRKRSGSHPPPQLLPFNHMSRTRPLVAVVDDDQRMRTALRRLLSAANFDAEAFPSGAEFLNSLQTRQPDCVVLDMDMPQLGGLAVQDQLTQAGFRLPVVVVTGSDSAATRAHALAAGASAYLAKPVDAQTLLDAIAAAISQPPAPTGSAENSTVSRHHPKPVNYDDRQSGNNG